MSRDDWYRQTTWSEENRDAFFARLKRSRSVYNKSQYARIQAHTLAEHALYRDSLALLDIVINEYPYPSELAQAYLQQAECHAALGETDAAITSYRMVLEAEQNYPNTRTQAWLKYPWFIVECNREDLFDEALEIIVKHEESRGLHFPIEIYRWAGVKAVLANALGRDVQARYFAAEALEASKQESSGLRYHPKIGLVTESGTRIHEKLLALARA